MPVHAQIDRTRQLTIYTIEGAATFDEIMNISKEFYSANPTLKVLWDLREGTIADISFKQIEKLTDFFSKMEQKTRVVKKLAAVTYKELDYGLLRMAQIFLDMNEFKPEFRIFRRFEDAVDWLYEQNNEVHEEE